MTVLARDPSRAADAFYWATRLDPAWAAPMYGRYAALLLSGPENELELFLVNRRKAVRTPRLRSLDSMAYAAELRNPFVDRRLDATILATWISRVSGGSMELRDLGRYDRRFTAWAAQARSDYQMATTVYREEIARHPEDAELLFMQGRNFFAQGAMDSARTVVQSALAFLRRDEEAAISVYVPHAFGEYSVGFLYGLSQQPDSAGAAYERALLDDVAFHPAHHELGRVRLAAHDTAGALAEYVEAVTLAPADGAYLYDLGMLLLTTGKSDSALRVLQRSAEVEPWFAPPHLPLGLILEHSGFTTEAISHYTSFLQLAPQINAAAIAGVRQRLDKLAAATPAP